MCIRDSYATTTGSNCVIVVVVVAICVKAKAMDVNITDPNLSLFRNTPLAKRMTVGFEAISFQ